MRIKILKSACKEDFFEVQIHYVGGSYDGPKLLYYDPFIDGFSVEPSYFNNFLPYYVRKITALLRDTEIMSKGDFDVIAYYTSVETKNKHEVFRFTRRDNIFSDVAWKVSIE